MITIDEVIERTWHWYCEHIDRQIAELVDAMTDAGEDADAIAAVVEHERQWFLEGWPSIETQVRRQANAFLLATDPRWPTVEECSTLH